MQKSFFEKKGGTYTQAGDYFITNLVIEESDQQTIEKYGRMRKRYLKEYRPALYSNLLLTGKLNKHLAEINAACEERMEFLVRQMAEREGVSEALKSADQMAWVAHMNSIRNRVEEVILTEMVYC